MDIKKLKNKEFRQYDYTSRYAPFPIYYHTLDKKIYLWNYCSFK